MGNNRTKPKKTNGKAPGFDEAALAKLTTKIDKSLPAKPDGALPQKRKRPQGGEDGSSVKRRQVQQDDTKYQQGQRERGAGKPAKGSPHVLLDEILALGGDEGDYQLVAGVDSGDEEEQFVASTDTNLDDSFRNELAKLASELGFRDLKNEDDSDTDASEESDESPYEDAADDEEPAEPVRPVPPAPQAQETRKQSGNGRLVSKPAHFCVLWP